MNEQNFLEEPKFREGKVGGSNCCPTLSARNALEQKRPELKDILSDITLRYRNGLFWVTVKMQSATSFKFFFIVKMQTNCFSPSVNVKMQR